MITTNGRDGEAARILIVLDREDAWDLMMCLPESDGFHRDMWGAIHKLWPDPDIEVPS